MPRYQVPIAVTVRVYVDMPNAVAAQNKVREAVMTARYQDILKPALQDLPGATAVVCFGQCPEVTEAPVIDIERLAHDPAARLNALWANSFRHTGPCVAWTDALLSAATALFKEITDDDERLSVHAAFKKHGVDLGPIALPRAIFTGEWFGYECTGGEHYDLGFRGYDSGSRWNGWAAPLLTLEALRGLVEWQRTEMSPKDAADLDTVEIIDAVSGGANVYFCHGANTMADNPDHAPKVLLSPRTVVTVDGFREVYEIQGDWCWSVYREGPKFPALPAFKKLVG